MARSQVCRVCGELLNGNKTICPKCGSRWLLPSRPVINKAILAARDNGYFITGWMETNHESILFGTTAALHVALSDVPLNKLNACGATLYATTVDVPNFGTGKFVDILRGLPDNPNPDNCHVWIELNGRQCYVDKGMANLLVMLNDLGYITQDSCEGHYAWETLNLDLIEPENGPWAGVGSNHLPYISFSDEGGVKFMADFDDKLPKNTEVECEFGFYSIYWCGKYKSKKEFDSGRKLWINSLLKMLK